MRYMVIIKADNDSEAGVLPDERLISEMLNFNEELTKAGVMQAAEGLQPSSKAVRVGYSKGKFSVTDGPFAESKEVIAGFWIWKLNSMEEAIEWVKRMPNPTEVDWEIEIRPLFDPAEDFGEAFTPELKAQEQRIREKVSGK